MGRGSAERGEVSSPQQSCCQSLSPNENCIVCWRSLFWILMLPFDFDAVVVIFIYSLLLFLLGFSLSYCCCICCCCLLLFCVFAAFAFAVNFAGGSSVCSPSLQRCFDYEAVSTFLPFPSPSRTVPASTSSAPFPPCPLGPMFVVFHLYLVCIGGVAFALLATSIKCNIEPKRPTTETDPLFVSIPLSLCHFSLFISLLCVPHSQLHSSLALSTLDKACRFTRMWRIHTQTHTNTPHTQCTQTHTDSG